MAALVKAFDECRDERDFLKKELKEARRQRDGLKMQNEGLRAQIDEADTDATAKLTKLRKAQVCGCMRGSVEPGLEADLKLCLEPLLTSPWILPRAIADPSDRRVFFAGRADD